MRLLFIGQAPSRETEGKPPFTGKCGKFLAEDLMGLSQEQMLRDHDFLNVFDHWPGKGIGGDKFPMAEAKIRAKKMLDQLKDRTVVLLGANVARAFGAIRFKYLGVYELRHPDRPSEVISRALTVVPHPSGVNRHWNNPKNREVAKSFLMQWHHTDREKETDEKSST